MPEFQKHQIVRIFTSNGPGGRGLQWRLFSIPTYGVLRHQTNQWRKAALLDHTLTVVIDADLH